MHTFIYPSKDSYITNENSYVNKNFGIDEILELKSVPQLNKLLNLYTNVPVSGTYSDSIKNFSGSFYGTISGSNTSVAKFHISSAFCSESYDSCSLSSSFSCISVFSNAFTSSNFNGTVTGSYNGTPTTGSILSGFSGSVSGFVTGSSTGSFMGTFSYASGSLTSFNGRLTGVVSGTMDVYEPYYTYHNIPELSRILIKFDLSSLSSSLATGNITTDNIKFNLKLKATQTDEVPTDYTIYAFPVSQSWNMGTGRYSTGGNSIGVSWNYTNDAGTDAAYWYGTGSNNSYSTEHNYFLTQSFATGSFSNQGGTWYYSVPNSFVQPTSSVKTVFFNTASSTPTFETQYSSSLSSSLTSSFSGFLSSSLNLILSSSVLSSSNADTSYNFINSFATTTYTNTSASISSSLASINISSSAYQTEYTSSVLFLNSLSSSIQTILSDSASLVTYDSQSYQYILSLSSSISSSTIYSDLYNTINNLVTASVSSSVSASYVYNAYTSFASSLSNQLSASYWYSSSGCVCDPTNQSASFSSSLLNEQFLSYVSSSESASIISSYNSLLNATFSSSVLQDFSSSLISYFNQGIYNLQVSTSASVASSLTQSFASKFCSTLSTGSSLLSSQAFSYTTSDINMDITNVVKGWLCGCIPNEGVILMTSLELSGIDNINGTIKFFGKETNTIYSPYLDVSWDDSVYNTGSMLSLSGYNPYTVVVKNLSREYKFGSLVRINLFAREKSPLKNFVKGTQQSQYLSSSLLSTNTYYAIKDNESENMVVDFDDYTKLSCDGSVHYFNLDTTTLPVARYYRLLIKTTINGEVKIFDNGNIFTITR